MTVGLRYARVKALISGRNPLQLEDFMQRHPVRVVLGPGDACYIVDHHHWAVAWQLMGVTHVPSHVVAERQQMQEEAFWRLMGKRRWVHPFSPTGSREPLEALPQSLDQLKDDPYQSLAARRRVQENEWRGVVVRLGRLLPRARPVRRR
ncbi:ParB-like protein [Paraburkholderia mimosarum]|nr:ParB-like protein [Paraburkholderia mimosarum]